MADHTIDSGAGEVAVHEILLTGGQQDVVTFGKDADVVEVISDGADELYVSTNGEDATDKGAHCFRLPADIVSAREIRVRTAGNTVVKLFSAGAVTYSVAEAS